MNHIGSTFIKLCTSAVEQVMDRAAAFSATLQKDESARYWTMVSFLALGMLLSCLAIWNSLLTLRAAYGKGSKAREGRDTNTGKASPRTGMVQVVRDGIQQLSLDDIPLYASSSHSSHSSPAAFSSSSSSSGRNSARSNHDRMNRHPINSSGGSICAVKPTNDDTSRTLLASWGL
eukprot:TRINITY_DN10814_c0_g1::TRINITY_DN10814_c0_g1_i1::g.10356::m.10356 TRINITY_DN10814_c0_g1::TRINITY_DN10814_c0_g1_i1::g.10356  ORF type:complete len:175 (+),score=31.43 TRINITY_DN10814_c0_g1_i1:3-527(+)